MQLTFLSSLSGAGTAEGAGDLKGCEFPLPLKNCQSCDNLDILGHQPLTLAPYQPYLDRTDHLSFLLFPFLNLPFVAAPLTKCGH